MSDTATLARLLADPAVTAKAAEKAAAEPRFWTGLSGMQVTGADVAAHLEAAREVLKKRGWIRTTDDTDPELPEADESMSVKTILLGVLRAVRDMTVDRGPITLMSAMFRAEDAIGDQDTHVVGDRVLDTLVAAYLGTSFAIARVWSEKRSRTWAEVSDLLTAGAEFARTHGPRP
ncbi:hypothetical protein ACIHCX_03295 [Streptomyces sp. NPDC052043]|uniref:DUF6197 family protein n=1 Tax=Streptomyces sp. NPDC052043 TaxID=3365684 RepID=UPI0037D172B3